ncbi:MAG: hypothetical protein WC979_01280 [Candidatus Pacearchaeota archaeon]
MNEFLMLLPNAIGTVRYNWESQESIPDSQKQAYVDGYTNEMMHALVQRSILNPGDVGDPTVEFMKAREAAKKLLEDSGMTTILKSLELQVGNKECLDYLFQIERNPKFKGWENQALINAYIIETKTLLKQNNI